MERPTKRPRRHEPEGFQKSRPTTPYKPPESVTKFVSTFDNPTTRDSPTRKKRTSLSIAGERPRNPFVDFDVPRQPEPGPSSDRPSASRQLALPLKVLKPPVFPHAEPSIRSTNASPKRHLLDKPRSILKPPPAPVLKPPQTTHAESSITSLQPIRNPPPPEKPRSVLKPPPLPVSSNKPAGPLKPLAPPPLPTTSSPKKPMKTILTTNIAQAIDPTKEGAGPELLSLFLQQHGHNFTSSTDRELQRGVMVSPDKRSRGKDRKFIRGGLAERFEHRIACSKTDLALWKRQTEQKIESRSKLAPDMRLRVLRVLDYKTQRPTLRLASGPHAGLALCRLLWRHPLAGDLAYGTYVVVFDFATTGSQSAVRSPDRFEEGKDVMVWMPWHKVELVGAEHRGLLDMFRTLDALTPPRSLLVLSRFCLVAPRVDSAA